MRGSYSLVRYVPYPERGEGINIGLVLADEDSIRVWTRFRTELPQARDLAYLIPDMRIIKSLEKSLQMHNRIDLRELSHDWANSIQITPPRSCSFADPQQFLESMFRQFVISPGPESHKMERPIKVTVPKVDRKSRKKTAGYVH